MTLKCKLPSMISNVINKINKSGLLNQMLLHGFAVHNYKFLIIHYNKVYMHLYPHVGHIAIIFCGGTALILKHIYNIYSGMI